MVAAHIITPQEAQEWAADETRPAPDPQTGSLLVLTVATEPDRIRAAVIAELDRLHDEMADLDPEDRLMRLWGRLDALRGGATL